MKQPDGSDIWLDSRLDMLDDNWFLWSAVREWPDGRVEEGSMQADFIGELKAFDTFEVD